MYPINIPIVIVWLDCVAGDVFVDMYERGELPNLYEFFSEGVFVRNSVTCFPTVSESAEGGIISGFFSGETNMVGERYFSRRQVRVKHYKFNARAEQDFEPSLRDRIIDVIIGESVSMGRIIHTSSEDVVDLVALQYERAGSLKIVERRIEVASNLALSRRPRLLFFTISADYISHVHGRGGEVVKKFIKEFDKEFPGLIEALDKVYGKDSYAIFVFSDHGSTSVSKHLDLPKLLLEHGFKPAMTDVLLGREDTKSAALSNGRRVGLVYFAHPEYGWKKKPSYKLLRNYTIGGRSIDLLRFFAQEEGVKQVFARRDDNSVTVVSRDGEGIIQYDPRGNRYRYTVLQGSDPLGYNIEPRWMSEDEWLRATYSCEHPDAIVQLYRIFSSENCGDLVLNAADGWDFWEPWDIPYPVLKASHGGLSRDEMVTFILARGPRMRNTNIGFARLIDIFATISTYYNADSLLLGNHAVERMLIH